MAMSKRVPHADMNLNEIPYSITHQIYMNFDVDRGWEHLASVIGYNTQQMKLFELEMKRPDGSPTKKLLWDWGSRGATARDLYNKLKLINKTHALRLLEDIVNGKSETDEKQKKVEDTETKASNSPAASSSSLPDICKDTVNRKLGKEDVVGAEALSYNPQSLPPPRRLPKLTMPSSQSGPSTDDVNLNNPKCDTPKMTGKHIHDDTAFSDPLNKESLKLTPVPVIDEKGAASVLINECTAAGPASGKGNMGPMYPGSLERVKSVVDVYVSQECMSQQERDVALALMGTHSYTYKELSQATEGFSDKFKLGQGAFGDVYYGLLKQTKCAIKKLFQRNERNDEDTSSSHLSAELRTLRKYPHVNLVPLYGYALDGDEVCLVYQYMENGSLEDRLHCKHGTAPLSWQQRFSIAHGAACGLQFLHTVDKPPLIHGDIKSANILLDRHFEAKIGDLGMAQHANARGGNTTGAFTHITKKQVGTKHYQCKAYLAPELSRVGGQSLKGDSFAFGVVLYEICTGELAFDYRREGKNSERFLADSINEELEDNPNMNCQKYADRKAGMWPEHIYNCLFGLGRKCTNEKKKDRPDMVKVYKELDQMDARCKKEETGRENEMMTEFMSRVNVNQPQEPPTGNQHMQQTPYPASGNYVPGVMAPVSSIPVGPPGYPKQSPYGAGTNTSSLTDNRIPVCSNPIKRLPKDQPMPEAFRLQVIHDNQKNDAYGKFSSGKDSDIYSDSDPRKLAEIEKYDREQRMDGARDNVKYTQSDPTKLEEIERFDQEILTQGQRLSELERSHSEQRHLHKIMDGVSGQVCHLTELPIQTAQQSANQVQCAEELGPLISAKDNQPVKKQMMDLFNRYQEEVDEVSCCEQMAEGDEEMEFQFDFQLDGETENETFNSQGSAQAEICPSVETVDYDNLPTLTAEADDKLLEHQNKLKHYQNIVKEVAEDTTEVFKEGTENAECDSCAITETEEEKTLLPQDDADDEITKEKNVACVNRVQPSRMEPSESEYV